MRTAFWIVWVLTVLASFIAGMRMRSHCEPLEYSTADTVIRVDTVKITMPQEERKRETGIVAARLVTADTVRDTVYVEVPLESKEYSGDGYRAYVSGWHASLDSIELLRRTEISIAEPAKTKRFSIGLQAGLGITPSGIQPYVGVGMSVKLW